MKILTSEQLKEYLLDPNKADSKVRVWVGIPSDRYYTVSIWPESNAGQVRVTNVHRTVSAKKISKSDQQ